jgi:hypothetical protein
LTRTPPLHPRSGCTGHVVSLGYCCFWLYSRFADRGNAVRVLLLLHSEARAATRTGPRTKRQRRRAQPGHSPIAPCCRRRIRRGAQRSSHTATMSRQAVDNPVVTALHRLFGALVALCCLVVALCWYSAVSSSCQHMSHRVQGGHSTPPLSVHVPARLSLLCRARAAFGPQPRGRIKRRDLLGCDRLPWTHPVSPPPASPSRLGLPPGRRACGGVPSLVPGVSRMTSRQARDPRLLVACGGLHPYTPFPSTLLAGPTTTR